MIYDTIPHTLHLDLHRQECRAVSALRWLESYQQTGYQEFLERALNELKAAEARFGQTKRSPRQGFNPRTEFL